VIDTEEARRTLLTIINDWGFVFYCLGHFSSQIKILKRHLPDAEACSDLALKAMYLAWYGFSLMQELCMNESYRVFQVAIRAAEESGNKRSIAYANGWAANACAEMGKFKEGQKCGGSARELAKDFPDDHYLLSKANFCTAQCFLRCGLVEKALQCAHESISLGHSQNKTRALVLGYSALGDICHAKGQYTEAVVNYRKAIDYAPDVFYRIWPIPFMALSLVSDDRLQEAEDALSLYKRIATAGEHPSVNIGINAITGLIASKRGAFSVAFRQAIESSQNYERSGYAYFHLITGLEIGRVYAGMALGTTKVSFALIMKNLLFILTSLPVAYQKAVKKLIDIVKLSQDMGAAGLEGQAWQQLGMLYLKKNKKEKAREAFRSAQEVFKKTDLIDYQETIRTSLAELDS